MADIVERLTVPLADNEEGVMKYWDKIRAHIAGGNRGSLPRDMFESLLGLFDEEREEAAETITTLRAEVDRCHARLEIDHEYRMGDTDDSDLDRVEIPMEHRAGQIDGIECRDATIAELERQLAAAREQFEGYREESVAHAHNDAAEIERLRERESLHRADASVAWGQVEGLRADLEKVRATIMRVDEEILSLARRAFENTTEERVTYSDGYCNGLYAARAITQDVAQEQWEAALATNGKETVE